MPRRGPSLDRAAVWRVMGRDKKAGRDGVRFERFYAGCPVCSPTRASVLTQDRTLGAEDVRPWLERASVFVAPLRFGAGIQNKLLALTMETLNRSVIVGWKASLRVPGRTMKTVFEHQEILDALGRLLRLLPGEGTGVILDYAVSGVPESFVVAPSGVVVAKVTGGVSAAGLDAIIAEVESRAEAGS